MTNSLKKIFKEMKIDPVPAVIEHWQSWLLESRTH
jgi:hypothetical protein